VLPDRSEVGMTQPFMAAYTSLVIKTCHRREIHAMGGMAAQIPIRRDPAANEAAMAKVIADKQREVEAGHDGTWVAHPGLIATVREIFDAKLEGPHQIHRKREDVRVGPEDLMRVPTGRRTEAGLRHNVRVGIQYLAAWLRGNGCVPLYDLMEDAATAEISRAQVWQWIHHRAPLDDGQPLTSERLRKVIDEEMQTMQSSPLDQLTGWGQLGLARALFERISTADELADFLTLPAYDYILSIEGFHNDKADGS
jgi:malate synthase